MEKIKKIAEMIAKNDENSTRAKRKHPVDQKAIDNLILNILIKNKYLEKLNAPVDAGFKDIDKVSSNNDEIKNQVKNLCDFGLISAELGELICQKFGVANNDTTQKTLEPSGNLEFDEELTMFFEKRNSLLDYLKNAGFDFQNGDLKKIVEVVKTLEEQAKTDYMQELYNNKMKAIKAPNSLANSTPGSEISAQKVFTKGEIGKMSTEEFLKNEKLIDKLIAKKLIKFFDEKYSILHNIYYRYQSDSIKNGQKGHKKDIISMTYFNLMNKVLLELGLNMLDKFENAHKNEHFRILEALKTANEQACRTFEWDFLIQTKRFQLKKGENTFEINGFEKMNSIRRDKKFLCYDKEYLKNGKILAGPNFWAQADKDKIEVYPQEKNVMISLSYISNHFATDAKGLTKPNFELADDKSVLPLAGEKLLIYGACMLVKSPNTPKYALWDAKYRETMRNLVCASVISWTHSPKICIDRASCKLN